MLIAPVIVLNTPQITTYTGSVALGFVPARVLRAMVIFPVATDGSIFPLYICHSDSKKASEAIGHCACVSNRTLVVIYIKSY